MVFLKLFVKIMLQSINQETDNSHFCNSKVCCSLYGCFCTLFMRKFTQKQPYNWEVTFSSSKSVWRVEGGSMILFTRFCDIKSWNSTRNPCKFVSIASVLKTKVPGKQSRCHTPYSGFNSVKQSWSNPLCHIAKAWNPHFSRLLRRAWGNFKGPIF